jgi:16S rRNA (guanine966-N2)-methyltransferase
VITANAMQWLEQHGGASQFDIIFLDPPYKLKLLPSCLALIDAGNFAASGCTVYLENDNALEELSLPARWHLNRSKKAGQVFYGVCEKGMI